MRFSYTKVFFIILLPILIFFHFRGVIVHDEGYILNSAQKFISGQIPYRDFHLSYTPLSVFLTSISFLIFGPSVFSSRILMLLLSLLSSVLIFKIVKFTAKKDLYAMLAVLMYVSWAPTHINFSWPVMYALPLTFLAIYSTLLYAKARLFYLPFVAGLCAFGVFLSKQNFGIILIPLVLHFLIIYRKNPRSFLTFCYGYFWGIILFVIYLLATSSFPGFISDFYTFTIKKVLISSEITTPLLFVDNPASTLLRAGFYFIMPLLSLATFALLVYRKKYYFLFVPIILLLYFLIGLRPTSDYVHLVPILSLAGIPAAIFINKLPLPSVKAVFYILFVVLIFSGFQTALYKGYYRWDIPLIENNTFITDRVGVFTNNKFVKEYRELKEITNYYLSDGGHIYFDTYAPLLYFLLDRDQPNPYDFPGFIDEKLYQEMALYELVAKDVSVVFLTNTTPDSPLKKYVILNYSFLKPVGDYFLYVKNP